MTRIEGIAAVAALVGLGLWASAGDMAAETRDVAADAADAHAAMAYRAMERACGDRAEVVLTARGPRCVGDGGGDTLVATVPSVPR